jgi:hypothetical protein
LGLGAETAGATLSVAAVGVVVGSWQPMMVKRCSRRSLDDVLEADFGTARRV